MQVFRASKALTQITKHWFAEGPRRPPGMKLRSLKNPYCKSHCMTIPEKKYPLKWMNIPDCIHGIFQFSWRDLLCPLVVQKTLALAVAPAVVPSRRMVGARRPGKPGRPVMTRSWRLGFTLWLCQNSYWKLPFIVNLSIKNSDFP